MCIFSFSNRTKREYYNVQSGENSRVGLKIFGNRLEIDFLKDFGLKIQAVWILKQRGLSSIKVLRSIFQMKKLQS